MRQIGHVQQINLNIGKGKPRVSLESAEFIAGMGLKGDVRFGDKIQLVALPYKSRKAIDESDEPGLCFERFIETLSIDFGDYIPDVGDVLLIRAGKFLVESTGKRCFAECEILKNGYKCELSRDVFHLAIQQSSRVACGDSVFLQGED